jgi:hypothetical protein
VKRLHLGEQARNDHGRSASAYGLASAAAVVT